MSNHARRQRRPRRERQDNLAVAALVSRLTGCTCQPDLEHRHRDGIANVTVRHDVWCPMAEHSSQFVIRPKES